MLPVKLLFIRIIVRLFSWVTPRMAEYIAPVLAVPVWYFSARKRRVTQINLHAAYPDMPVGQRKHIARASLVHYVRGVLEAGMLWHWPTDKIFDRFDAITGLESFRVACRQGKGVIVAAPHYGAWELLGLYLQQEIVGTILYKPGRHPDIETLLLEKRSRLGARMVPANAAGLKALYKTLKAGKSVSLLPDQEPSLGVGRFAPFFGIETLTSVLLPKLVQKTGAAVVFCVCERRTNGRYCVHLLSADDALYDKKLCTALGAVNRGIEHCIDIDQRQYLWAYKRFRTRPEGEKPFYP